MIVNYSAILKYANMLPLPGDIKLQGVLVGFFSCKTSEEWLCEDF